MRLGWRTCRFVTVTVLAITVHVDFICRQLFSWICFSATCTSAACNATAQNTDSKFLSFSGEANYCPFFPGGSCGLHFWITWFNLAPSRNIAWITVAPIRLAIWFHGTGKLTVRLYLSHSTFLEGICLTCLIGFLFLSLSLILSLSLFFTHILTHRQRQARTLIFACTHSHAYPVSLTYTFSLSYTHPHTSPLSFSLFLTPTHAYSTLTFTH